jgi:hypothetical protein
MNNNNAAPECPYMLDKHSLLVTPNAAKTKCIGTKCAIFVQTSTDGVTGACAHAIAIQQNQQLVQLSVNLAAMQERTFVALSHMAKMIAKASPALKEEYEEIMQIQAQANAEAAGAAPPALHSV